MGNKFINIISKVIIFIAVVFSIVLIFAVYSNANESEKEDGKIEEEIRYLDNKLLTIINYLNNINLQNYKMSLTKIEAESNSSGSNQKGGKEEGGNEKGGSEDSSSKNGANNEETAITKMERETIVTEDKKETDWETIEGETEILYSSWAPIVLDLYKINVNKEDILSFSDTLDETILSIKKQDKALTAMYLSKLYGHLPKFVKNIRNGRNEKRRTGSKKLPNKCLCIFRDRELG